MSWSLFHYFFFFVFFLPVLVFLPFLYEFRYVTGLHWCCECYYERSCMRTLLSFMAADFLVPPVVNVPLLFQALETLFIRAKCEWWLKRKYHEWLMGNLVGVCQNYQLWFLYSKADEKKFKTLGCSVVMFKKKSSVPPYFIF